MNTLTSTSLWRRHVLPFFLMLALLGLATMAGDFLLHWFDWVWVGRYLGIPGTLLILVSFWYSLHKRKYVKSGKAKTLLKAHEWLAWLGSLLILVHAGVHFNSILAWLATLAMGVNVISGLIGKYLLRNARDHVMGTRAHYQLRGLARTEVEQAVFWDAVAVDTMAQWRKVHIPIFVVFAVLALGHIFSVFLFWGWV